MSFSYVKIDIVYTLFKIYKIREKSMSVIDVGGNVREGEELDVRAVGNWLIENGSEISGPCRSDSIFRWSVKLDISLKIRKC